MNVQCVRLELVARDGAMATISGDFLVADMVLLRGVTATFNESDGMVVSTVPDGIGFPSQFARKMFDASVGVAIQVFVGQMRAVERLNEVARLAEEVLGSAASRGPVN